ncbi:MAG: very short patch repair endonuclease, partial [Thermoplasmata archaeon]
VNGCFWHRCPKCNTPIPHSNRDYWESKFKANTERDERKLSTLRKLGWHTLIIWECEIREDTDECARRIFEELRSQNGTVH